MFKTKGSDMRHFTVSAAAITLLASAATASADDVKQVPYPEVKVQVPAQYTPDAGFLKLQKALSAAIDSKNAQAVSSLVGPTFVWTQDGAIADQFDYGGDALQNFKVVFGFRAAGKHADGGVKDGPYWETLFDFAANKKLQKVTDTLVCGPMKANVTDVDVFDQAGQKLGGGDSIEWYFTLGNTAVTATPRGGAVVGQVGQVAMPVLDQYPQSRDDSVAPTSFKVLMSSGKTGWIPASAAMPLSPERLCYAMTADGNWKIVAYQQSE
jgi:hypothetical protein